MPFARWNDFSECTLEQRKLGHDEEAKEAFIEGELGI